MKMKNILVALLALCLFFSGVAVTPLSAWAEPPADTAEEEKISELDALKEALEETLGRISEIETQKEDLIADLSEEDCRTVFGKAALLAGETAIQEQESAIEQNKLDQADASAKRDEASKAMAGSKKTIRDLITYKNAIQAEMQLRQKGTQLQAGYNVLQKEQEAAAQMLEAAWDTDESEGEKETFAPEILDDKAQQYLNLVTEQNVQITEAQNLNSQISALTTKDKRGDLSESVSVSDTIYPNYTTTMSFYDTASSSAAGEAVVNYALQFVGNPYVWGGTSLTNGCDCSGFVQQVFAHFGVPLTRTTYTQCSEGVAVSYQEMQPGDVIYYGGHTSIYIGNNRIVHAADEVQGIIVQENPAFKPIITIRRFIF